jgi:hypothetical protein
VQGTALVVSSAVLAHKGQELGPGFAHLILMDQGDVFGVQYDVTRAHETAQVIGRALVTVPLAADAEAWPGRRSSRPRPSHERPC